MSKASQLGQVQRLFDAAACAPRHISAPATAAVAAAQHLSRCDQLQQALAAMQGQQPDSVAQDEARILALKVLQQLLEPPPADSFSGLGGVPGVPDEPGPAADAASEHLRAVALQLQLLVQLLRCLGPLRIEDTQTQQQKDGGDDDGGAAYVPLAQQHMQQRVRSRSARSSAVVGIVEIEEVDEAAEAASSGPEVLAAQQQQGLVRGALEVCALYGRGPYDGLCAAEASAEAEGSKQDQPCPEWPRLDGAGGSGSGGGSGTQSPRTSGALESLLHSTVAWSLRLHTPWTDAGCAEHSCTLLQQLARQTQPQAATSASEGAPSMQQQEENQVQQQQRVQELLAGLMPQLLQPLREPLLAQHKHRQAAERGGTGVWLLPCLMRWAWLPSGH